MDCYGDSFACFYDRYFCGYSEHSAPYLLHFAFNLLPENRMPKILDLGCGTGHLVKRFLEAGYDVTGLDLSPAMLALAKTKCLPHLYSGKASFVKADLSQFDNIGPFELAISTYNVFNHLTESQLNGAFHSLSNCLSPGGMFLFDYQTRMGLSEWVAQETIPLGQDSLKTEGQFDEKTGSAWMRVKGTMEGRPFDETIFNFSVPLKKLRSLLGKEGWDFLRVARLDRLNEELDYPEEQKRVVFLARRKV